MGGPRACLRSPKGRPKVFDDLQGSARCASLFKAVAVLDLGRNKWQLGTAHRASSRPGVGLRLAWAANRQAARSAIARGVHGASNRVVCELLVACLPVLAGWNFTLICHCMHPRRTLVAWCCMVCPLLCLDCYCGGLPLPLLSGHVRMPSVRMPSLRYVCLAVLDIAVRPMRPPSVALELQAAHITRRAT